MLSNSIDYIFISMNQTVNKLTCTCYVRSFSPLTPRVGLLLYWLSDVERDYLAHVLIRFVEAAQ